MRIANSEGENERALVAAAIRCSSLEYGKQKAPDIRGLR
jgi:hypothetical protein